MHNYFYNPCTAYCASSPPKNNRVGVTTLIYFMRWTYIINQYNHYKNNFAHLLISKSATNSLKQIYRTCLITVCFVHNVPSFFAIIVFTLWYIRNTSGMVRGLFGDCSGFLRFVFFDVMTLTCSLCCDRMLLSRTFYFLCSNRPLLSFCHL